MNIPTVGFSQRHGSRLTLWSSTHSSGLAAVSHGGASGGSSETPPRIYTVGFSTRTVDALVELLASAGVGTLVDVRTMPRSRHTPQWNREEAARALPRHGIQYHHLPALGGFRKARPDSPNIGWRNLSFRGYADYMATPAFAAGLEALLQLAAPSPTAFACTEAVPWRCHRSLIADALTVRGIAVRHLMSPTAARLHALTPFARVTDGLLSYPDPDALL